MVAALLMPLGRALAGRMGIGLCALALALAIASAALVAHAPLRAAEPTDDMTRLRQVQATPLDDAPTREALTRDQLRNPPYFLYELARRELARDAAAAGGWFVVALLRVRYDGMRCKDPTAASDLGVLAQIAPDVAARMQDRSFRARAATDALARTDLFAATASPLWACSHGLEAMQAALENRSLPAAAAIRPVAEWPAIQSRLREQLANLAR